jgi:hypothetical protein
MKSKAHHTYRILVNVENQTFKDFTFNYLPFGALSSTDVSKLICFRSSHTIYIRKCMKTSVSESTNTKQEDVFYHSHIQPGAKYHFDWSYNCGRIRTTMAALYGLGVFSKEQYAKLSEHYEAESKRVAAMDEFDAFKREADSRGIILNKTQLSTYRKRLGL